MFLFKNGDYFLHDLVFTFFPNKLYLYSYNFTFYNLLKFINLKLGLVTNLEDTLGTDFMNIILMNEKRPLQLPPLYSNIKP